MFMRKQPTAALHGCRREQARAAESCGHNAVCQAVGSACRQASCRVWAENRHLTCSAGHQCLATVGGRRVQARTGRWTRTRPNSWTPSPSATARARPARAPRTPRPWRRISSCAGDLPNPLIGPCLCSMHCRLPSPSVPSVLCRGRAACQLTHAARNAVSLYTPCMQACRHQPSSPRGASFSSGRLVRLLSEVLSVYILDHFCRQCGKPRSGGRTTRPPPRGPRQPSRRPPRPRRRRPRRRRRGDPCWPSARASRSSLLPRSRRQPQTARRLRRPRQWSRRASGGVWSRLMMTASAWRGSSGAMAVTALADSLRWRIVLADHVMVY